jgi:hypothetical protein
MPAAGAIDRQAWPQSRSNRGKPDDEQAPAVPAALARYPFISSTVSIAENPNL